MKMINLVNHTLCPELLMSDSIVIDLGANHGAFAHEMADRFNCKTYAVEASPSVFSKIKPNDKVKKFNIAICGASGPVELNISDNPEATSIKRLSNAEYVETITIPGLTLDEFLKTESIPQVSLLKMDIEGAEIDVFNQCSDSFLRSVDQITVEFHEWTGASSQIEVENVVRRLRLLGFYVFKLTRKDFSDVLFIHRRRISSVDYIFTMLCIWIPRVIRYVHRRLIGYRHRPR